MIYIIYTVLALVLTFGLSFLVTGLIRRKMKKKIPAPLHVIIGIAAGFAVIFAAAAVYLNIHYSAKDEAIAVFADKSRVSVSDIDGAYFIDGEGKDTALIFYPGAKVDAEAYLPLMKRLAEKGTDCFLIKPAFRLAFLSANAADKIIDCYSYSNYLVSGHSLGGVVASSFAADNTEKVDGIVLLAAYTTKKSDVPLLSLYGSEDKVLDKTAYDAAKKLLPDDFTEVVIDGGNHSGFGNYGAQDGDGKPCITNEEQQSVTVKAVLEFENKYLSKKQK